MVVRGAGGSMESGGETNADLSALGSAINDGFRDLEANPESGGDISVPGGEEEEITPPADEDEPSDVDEDEPREPKEPKEPVVAAPAEVAAPPAVVPPVEPGKSQPGEPPSIPATPAKLMNLDGLAKDHLDAVRKFVSGNTLEGISEDAFAAAEQKMVADYWRLQRENAALAKAAKPQDAPADPAASQPAPPKEVEHIHARMQEIVTSDGPRAREQCEAWKAHAGKLRNDLATKEASGELDSDEINKIYRAINAADRNSELWQKTYNKHSREFRDLNLREQEVRLTLDTRDRLDRQEKKAAEDAREGLSNSFLTDWNKTYDEVLSTDSYKALDAEDKAALRMHAMAQTYFEAGKRDGGIAEKDVKGFLSKVIEDYVAPIKRAEERAKKELATAKAVDAPKIPPQANRPRKPRENKTSRSAEPSLRELEIQINKHEAWDKV